MWDAWINIGERICPFYADLYIYARHHHLSLHPGPIRQVRQCYITPNHVGSPITPRALVHVYYKPWGFLLIKCPLTTPDDATHNFHNHPSKWLYYCLAISPLAFISFMIFDINKQFLIIHTCHSMLDFSFNISNNNITYL